MEDKSKKRAGIKTAIVILSILLALSIAALAGVLINRSVSAGNSIEVAVPDNIITPDADEPGAPASGLAEGETENSEAPTDTADDTASPTDASSGDSSAGAGTSGSTGQTGTTAPQTATPTEGTAQMSTVRPTYAPTGSNRKAAVISLHQKQAEDNQPFQVRRNFFPGDSETQYFCVKVSHSGDVIVRYHADIRPGYEKLAEVLRCRIVLQSTGETLYDGLMRDMPKSLSYTFKAKQDTESELYYEITAYLDTSVGNEYQDEELIADFRWWVEDTSNLNPPYTGDNFHLWLYIAAASVSLAVLLLLWKRSRKEAREND